MAEDSQIFQNLNSFTFPHGPQGFMGSVNEDEEMDVDSNYTSGVDHSANLSKNTYTNHMNDSMPSPRTSFKPGQGHSNSSSFSFHNLNSMENSRNSMGSTISTNSSKYSNELPLPKPNEHESTLQPEIYNPFKPNRSHLQSGISPFGTKYEPERNKSSIPKDNSTGYLSFNKDPEFNHHANHGNTLDLYKSSLPPPQSPRRVSINPSRKYRHSRNLSITSSPVSPQESSFSFTPKPLNNFSFSMENKLNPNKIPSDILSKRRTTSEYIYKDKGMADLSQVDYKPWENVATNQRNSSISYDEFDDKNTGLVKSSSNSLYSLDEAELVTIKHHRPSVVYVTSEPTQKLLDLNVIDNSSNNQIT